jgi:5-methylcytosine-specific restriction endonuclease McrA
MALDSYHNYVLEIFHYRCVRCGRPTRCVHEIVPRSRRPKTWMLPDNRVAICTACHLWAHSKGARTSAPELEILRRQRLEEYERRT